MVPGVEGSSPFTHPTEYQGLGAIPIPDSFSTQGCSQVVRQGTLTPSSAGSSPAIPATPFRMAPSFFHMCHAPLAQSVEHLPFKQGVRGSNPRWSTKKKPLKFQEILDFSTVSSFFFRRIPEHFETQTVVKSVVKIQGQKRPRDYPTIC